MRTCSSSVRLANQKSVSVKKIVPDYFLLCSCKRFSWFIFSFVRSKNAMDRLGDFGPHQHLGCWQNAAGTERREQNLPHFHHHIQPAGLPGLLPNARAVPDEAEETQIQLQAVLPKQVGVARVRADDRNLWELLTLFIYLLFYCFCTAVWKVKSKSGASFTTSWEGF